MLHRFKMRNFATLAPDDGSGGGDSSASSEEAAPAQGADGNASILEQISSLMDTKLAAHSDSLHASVRRQLDARTKTPKAKPAAQESKSQSDYDPKSDIRAMMQRERQLGAAMAGVQMPEGARSRMQAAYDREQPENVQEWASQWFSDFGFAPGEAQAKTQAQTPSTPPVTGSTSPAPPAAFSENTPLIKLSPADREALVKKKGAAWFRETLREQMRNTKVKVRNI